MKTLTFSLLLLSVIGVHAQQYVGSDNPSIPLGDGTNLVFSGVANNSDPMWIRKHNVSNNVTELRINIGDDPINSYPDFLVVGATAPDGWYPRFTVSASGKIGIGTTSPNAPLQFSNDLANRKVVLWETGNNDHEYYGFGVNSSVLRYQANTGASHAFYTAVNASSSSELMRINLNGVGIGTTSPDGFQVNRTLNSEARQGTDNVRIGKLGTTARIILDDDAPNAVPFEIDNAAGKFRIYNPGVERFNITADGNTHVLGQLYAGQHIRFKNYADNKDFITGQYEPIIYSSTSGGTIPGGSSSLVLQAGGTTAGRHIFFRTLDATRMMITDQGKVGIGITSPHHELDVKGKIHSQEVIVDMNGWSDYVFDSTYNLPPLSQVEAYIKTNKHLPEIPSEAEVKENGVAVGEMNALLLKKIEELTLYVIELSKKNEALEQKNAILEKQQASLDLMRTQIEELQKLVNK